MHKFLDTISFSQSSDQIKKISLLLFGELDQINLIKKAGQAKDLYLLKQFTKDLKFEDLK